MYILDYIGDTPLIEIWKKEDRRIYAKLESMNPSGSIKDRTALWLINSAEEKGLLKNKNKIVEPSSGNTGISLAMIGAMKGYKVTIIMPEYASKMRTRYINAYGGEVIIVPAKEWREGAIELAKEITDTNRHAIFLNQYESEANINAHYYTTAVELMSAVKVDYLVAGIGTGGTILGITKRLKRTNPELKVIGVQPAEGEVVQGLMNTNEHKSKLLTKYGDLIDYIYEIKSEEAREETHSLWNAGYFVGYSSGAVFRIAKKLARSVKGNIVVIFPDSGNRYI